MTLSEYQTMIQRWSDQEKEAATKKLHDYMGDPADVLGLLKQIANRRRRSIWDVWLDWSLRHQIPLEQIIAQMSDPDGMPSQQRRQILQWRMQDLLGYCFVALAILQEETETEHQTFFAWQRKEISGIIPV